MPTRLIYIPRPDVATDADLEPPASIPALSRLFIAHALRTIGTEEDARMAEISNNLERFQNFFLEIEKLISDSSKEDLAECARLLAFNLALYKQKYGELPKEAYKKMLTIESIESLDDETGAVLASGILEMGVMLCQATGRLDEIEKLKGLGKSH